MSGSLNTQKQDDGHLLYSKSNEFRIVIITGSWRSGKTVLAKILGSLENVEYLEEPYLPMMLPVMQGIGLIKQKVAKNLMQAFTNELFNDVVLLRQANFRPKDDSTIWTRKNNAEILHRLTNLQSRKDVQEYIKDKNPILLYVLSETAPFLPFLIDSFPKCKIIHVIRNGLDVAFDTENKGWFSDKALIAPKNAILYRQFSRKTIQKDYFIPWWVEKDQEESFLSKSDFARGVYYWRRLLELNKEEVSNIKTKHLDQYKEVKYEDITADPGKAIDKLSEFIGSKQTGQTLSLKEKIYKPLPTKKINSKIKELPESELKKINLLLCELGYDALGGKQDEV